MGVAYSKLARDASVYNIKTWEVIMQNGKGKDLTKSDADHVVQVMLSWVALFWLAAILGGSWVVQHVHIQLF